MSPKLLGFIFLAASDLVHAPDLLLSGPKDSHKQRAERAQHWFSSLFSAMCFWFWVICFIVDCYRVKPVLFLSYRIKKLDVY
jgi:hypothetical protein